MGWGPTTGAGVRHAESADPRNRPFRVIRDSKCWASAVRRSDTPTFSCCGCGQGLGQRKDAAWTLSNPILALRSWSEPRRAAYGLSVALRRATPRRALSRRRWEYPLEARAVVPATRGHQFLARTRFTPGPHPQTTRKGFGAPRFGQGLGSVPAWESQQAPVPRDGVSAML